MFVLSIKFCTFQNNFSILFQFIYLYFFVSKKLTTIVKGNQKAPFQ